MFVGGDGAADVSGLCLESSDIPEDRVGARPLARRWSARAHGAQELGAHELDVPDYAPGPPTTIFLDLSFSGKLSEYIIMNKAVICSRLKTIGRYFSDEALAFFEPSNPADLAKQMVSMYGDMARRLRLAETAKREYLPIRWGVMKERYLKVMEHLSGGSVAERESDHNGSNSAEAVCRLSERGRLDKRVTTRR